VVRVLDGIDAFLDQLAAVDPLPVFLAVLAQLAKLTCTSMAWRNVLSAAYPDRIVRRRSIVGAYLAGVGVNAIVPLRAGDAVRVLLAHRAVAGSTYTTIVSSTLVLSIFDIVAASTVLAWAALTQDALPGLGDLRRLPSFDFSWLLERPLAAELVLAALVLAAVVAGIWIHGHVVDFWERVKQAFTVVRRPALYLRTVAFWQAGDWIFRLVAIWFLLDAFDIPQSPENVLLVQVSASIATLLPLTPAGIGTEQAFLLYVFRGAVPSSQLLAFSVGLKFMTVGTNVVAGFTAIALTLRTLRYNRALEPAERVPET
jgi:glycosyltransferase 2 family protein